MENEVMVYDDNVPAIADDSLLRVAEMAEKRIDAVIKIKQMALKVTNSADWVDQNGKPYMLVSGAEKIGNLFNISWRIDEPNIETEPDGHFTYTMKGIFSIPGRSISAEGSRSSKDPFFKKYDWIEQGPNKPKKKIEKPISAIDRRDVRMAALTNLLGNGISRLLGIRNLSYADLEAFANIKKEDIGKIEYGKKDQEQKPPIQPPQSKQQTQQPTGDTVTIQTLVTDIKKKEGNKNGKDYCLYEIVDANGQIYKTFSHTFATTAETARVAKAMCEISFQKGKFGNDVKFIELAKSESENDIPI